MKDDLLREYVRMSLSLPTSLAMFDFDDTLLRSDGGGWISSTVAAAYRCCGRPDVLAVMMTGRPPAHSAWVTNQLSTMGIEFAECYFTPPTEDVGSFKSARLVDILNSDPSITLVEIWDDQHPLLRRYGDICSARGLNVRLHPLG